MTIFTPFARIGHEADRNGDTVSEPEKEKLEDGCRVRSDPWIPGTIC
ncbi:hypothetical protein [Amycolatopsis sp. cg9]